MSRGGGWVAAQVVLLALLAVAAPMTAHEASGELRAVAIAVAFAGPAFALWAAVTLGRLLTPFPKPVDHGRLCREGPYRWARHPIYAGVLLVAIGWTLWWQSAIGAILLPGVFAFFALKARAEERWLRAAYPDYAGYAKDVKAIVPFVY